MLPLSYLSINSLGVQNTNSYENSTYLDFLNVLV